MKIRIHVCFLVSSLCNEGPVNVMYNIIKYMNFERFKVSIITFIPEKETTRINDFKQLPISIYQLNKIRKSNIYELYKQLKSKLAELNPDELHAHCPRSLYLMAFLPRKYKKIYTIHIYPGRQQLILYGRIIGRIVIILNHLFTKLCDKAIGCSESIGWQYKENKGWDVECVPNGCSLPIWHYNTKEKSLLRKEFGLKEGVKYFIFIGRFSKEKNPDILVKAFNMVNRKDVGLIMLGDGILREQLLEQKVNTNIIMPGFTIRVYDYLKASDYYISASDVEGLANTILESMSVGLPMLLSDIPSHKEILMGVGNEVVGYIIENHNPHDICRKIADVLLLNSDEVRKCLQGLYQSKYTAKIMSEQYQKIYEREFVK